MSDISKRADAPQSSVESSVPYIITGDTRSDIDAIQNLIERLQSENSSIQESKNNRAIESKARASFIRTSIANTNTIIELSFLLDAISIPNKYPSKNRILSASELFEVRYECERLHQECNHLVECGNKARSLRSASGNESKIFDLNYEKSNIELIIKSILLGITQIYYPDIDNLNDNSLQENKNSNTTSKGYQSKLPPSADIMRLLIILLSIFSLTLLASNRSLHAEYSQAAQQSDDSYYELEEQYYEAIDDASELQSDYDELYEYSQFLEGELENLRDDYEDLSEILEEYEYTFGDLY